MRFLFLTIIVISILALHIRQISGLEYLLALERCKGAEPGAYTIHGLWPNYNHTSWPQFCNTTRKFDFQAVKPLLPQIDRWWQTCPEYHHTEYWFLQHEWLKHGTCTNFTEAQFFGTGLALYKIYPWQRLCNPNDVQCLLLVSAKPY